MTRSATTVRLPEDDMARLKRLAEASQADQSTVIREALLLYELEQSYVRDNVRDAVLALAAAVAPDGQYDPADDPRPEQAVLALAALLGSVPAAEGVQLALMALRHLRER